MAASGGTTVEGYPEDPTDVDFGATGSPGYVGLVPAFEDAGYGKVGRLSNGRLVYHATLQGVNRDGRADGCSPSNLRSPSHE